jgi:hypothetical protein
MERNRLCTRPWHVTHQQGTVGGIRERLGRVNGKYVVADLGSSLEVLIILHDILLSRMEKGVFAVPTVRMFPERCDSGSRSCPSGEKVGSSNVQCHLN